MRVIPIGLAGQYSGAGNTLCGCMVLTLRDTTVIYLTTIDQLLPIDGNTYMPWLQLSDIVSTNTLGVDNLELTIVTDEPALQVDLEAGRYDNASFVIFETNFLNPSDGKNYIKRGTTGEAKLTDNGTYTLEFRGLTQALAQTVGIVTSKTCRAHFADYPKAALGAKCLLSAAANTFAGTITSHASNQVATDSTRSEAADAYTEGFLKFMDGDNAGYERQVKAFALGQFTFVVPFPFDIADGDAYSAILGCRKRLEDCQAHSNVVNMQAEPNLPGVDVLTKVPGVGT